MKKNSFHQVHFRDFLVFINISPYHDRSPPADAEHKYGEI